MTATATLAVHNPYDDELVGEVPLASPEQLRRRLDAGAAYENRLSRHERSEILFAVAEQIRARRDSAAARLRAAKQAHIDYTTTYQQGPVGKALGTNGYAGQYDQPASAVPRQAIVAGDKGYETARSFLKAADNSPGAVAAMKDMALAPLRQGLTHDGLIPQNAYAAWRSKYAPALRALDEVSPGFSEEFSNAAKATDVLARAGAVRQARLDEIQKGAAGKLLGKTDPSEVEATVLGMLSDKKNGASQIQSTLRTMKASPEALAGLQKAAIDGIAKKFVNTAEAGTSGEKSMASAAFQKFVAENRPRLQILLPQENVNTMGAVAADLERANRDITGTRIKGSPGTAKDLGALAKKLLGDHGSHSLLSVGLFEAFRDALEGGGLHGMAIAGGMASLAALNAIRSHGMSAEQAMFRDALLNPAKARLYLSKVSGTPKVGPLAALTGAVRRDLIAAPIVKSSLVQSGLNQ